MLHLLHHRGKLSVQLFVAKVPCHQLLLTAQLLADFSPLNLRNTSVLLSPFNIEGAALPSSQLSGGVWCLEIQRHQRTLELYLLHDLCQSGQVSNCCITHSKC